MGFARYKSTGDMLTTFELNGGYRKKSDSGGEENEDDYGCGAEYYDARGDDDNKPDGEAVKPLLKQRRRYRTETNCTNDDSIKSCKLFTDIAPTDRPEAEEIWRKHWKSAGDFLALNVQTDNYHQEKQQQTKVVTAQKNARNKRAGGAATLRRRKAAAKIKSLASLSLSSPVLVAQRQLLQQRGPAAAHLKTDGLADCELPPGQQVKCEHYTSQTAQQRLLEMNAAGDKLASRLDNGGSEIADAARGTMAAMANPMERIKTADAHCFVDVAHLKRRELEQQLASHLSSSQQQPQQQVTNGWFSSSNSYEQAARQDNNDDDYHSDQRCVRAVNDNDNGTETTTTSGCCRLPGRGVGVAVDCCSPAYAIATAETTYTRRQSDCSGRQAQAAECGGAQSANACCCPVPASGQLQPVAAAAVSLPDWHPRQKQNRPTATTAAYHAPIQQQQQQVVTGNQPPPKQQAGKNHSLDSRKLKQLPTIADNQLASLRSSELLVLNDDENCSLDYLNNYKNTANNKLMGSCCESWRYALQPNKSGTYKVAQQQEQQRQQQVALPISGHTSYLETANQILLQQQQETATAASGQHGLQRPQLATNANIINIINNATPTNAERNKIATTTRHFRPGRSPKSLQRLTNARLAKHRLKIQQQRQEQLAQLAIRDRQQLSQFNHRNRLQANIGVLPPPLEHVDRSQSAVFHIDGIFDRFAPYGSDTSDNRYKRPNCGESSAIARQQQQVISPNTTRIEICDNQLACSSNNCSNSSSSSSSSSSSRTSQIPYHNISKDRQCSGGNVFVYKSIDMLRNGPSSDNRHQSAGGKRSNEFVENDEIESDPDTVSSAGSTSSLNRPFCKVCHIGATKNGDKLISPCRCSGTMQFIHCGCLLKWLEISNRSNEKSMSCELCAYEYTWHKKFNYKQLGWPRCSIKDAVLHLIFLAAIGVMLFSAISPMLQKKAHDTGAVSNVITTPPAGSLATEQPKSNSHQTTAGSIRPFHHSSIASSNRLKHSTGHLADDEKFMLFCAASFFMSFFLAIYVQTKARDTLYSLIVKFLNMNQTYYITEYDHGQLNNNNSSNNNSGSGKQYVEEGSRELDRKGSAQKD